ncbi:DUF7576 family protein [Halomarina litorea]|uniref:DUF7576 family protein n=1 Tax=Halomarina litorea TaxID=2961595 RepID=UPI0020C5760B|nr:hypothetical protein [Halomarina sp. BCD28]
MGEGPDSWLDECARCHRPLEKDVWYPVHTSWNEGGTTLRSFCTQTCLRLWVTAADRDGAGTTSARVEED